MKKFIKERSTLLMSILAVFSLVVTVMLGVQYFYPNMPTPREEKTVISSTVESTSTSTSELATHETEVGYTPPSTDESEESYWEEQEKEFVSMETEYGQELAESKEAPIVVIEQEPMDINEAASIALSVANGYSVMLDEEDEYVFIFGAYEDMGDRVSRKGTVYVNKNRSGAELVE